LSKLERCIKKNRLGFVVESQDSISDFDLGGERVNDLETADSIRSFSSVNSSVGAEERIKAARALKKLRMQMENLKQLHQQKIELERQRWSDEKEAMLKDLHVATKTLEHADLRYNKLASKLENAEKQLSLAEQHQKKVQNVESDEIGAESEFATDASGQESSQLIKQLKEQLDLREFEVYYRDQKIETLNEELLELEKKNSDIQMLDDNSALLTLSKLGVHFVLSLPALGPISIAIDHIADYLRDPNAYLADRLKMNRKLYEQWFAHAHQPSCIYANPNGEVCGKPINIVLPNEFVSGFSDHCESHKFKEVSNDVDQAS
jgi:hypothetical protein